MSGHSKWANIKHRKGRQDAKRGNLVRAVEAAAREGGADIAANATLGTAVQKAKDASVPRQNIDRAVARGSGGLDGVDYEEIWYEGYGPGGVAVFVHVLTDNRNRAASGVRATFNKNNGSLGEPGSVSYLFEQKGYILATGDEETVILAALDGGAEDVTSSDDQWEVVTGAGRPPAGPWSSRVGGGRDRTGRGHPFAVRLDCRHRGYRSRRPPARRRSRGSRRRPGCVREL